MRHAILLWGMTAIGLLTACKVQTRIIGGGDGSGGAGGEGGARGGVTAASYSSSSSSSSASSSSSGGLAGTAALPIAPGPGNFMWQGTQRAFVDHDGNACEGTVAIAVGDQAVCYAGPGGQLRCAGSIGKNTWGSAFTPVDGAGPVDQILISLTANGADHNSICVHRPDGTAACMGEYNDHGQFGTGTTAGTATFVPWGSVTDLRALGTGTWDQMCGLTQGGALYCAGYGNSTTPWVVNPSVQTFVVDTFGMIVGDIPNIFRAASGRTDCLVQDGGFICKSPPPNLPAFGAPGHVVDGTYAPDYTPPGTAPGKARFCWLEDTGAAQCAIADAFDAGVPPQYAPVFTAQPVLALAGNPYSTSLCAVYADGSIACSGDNSEGQLGIPGPSWIASETIVAPPGSFDLACK